MGLLVIFRRHASSLWRRWAHLSSFGAIHRRWVVTWPVLVVVGGPISRRWVAVRAYSSSLERRRALLVFIGSRRCWVVLLFVIGSSFPHADVIRVTMVGMSWSRLIRYASVVRNVGVEHMWSEVRKKEKNDENERRPKSWFAFVTY